MFTALAFSIALMALPEPAQGTGIQTPNPHAAQPGSIADTIGELRARSNAAILARDLDTVLATVDDRTVLIAGNGGVESGREASRSGWAQEFADPDFVTYVRTTAAIVANPNGQRAAESGTWIGTFRPSEGETRVSGNYFVHWVLTDGVWRVRSETYVTLACDGPGCRPPR